MATSLRGLCPLVLGGGGDGLPLIRGRRLLDSLVEVGRATQVQLALHCIHCHLKLVEEAYANRQAGILFQRDSQPISLLAICRARIGTAEGGAAAAKIIFVNSPVRVVVCVFFIRCLR